MDSIFATAPLGSWTLLPLGAAVIWLASPRRAARWAAWGVLAAGAGLMTTTAVMCALRPALRPRWPPPAWGWRAVTDSTGRPAAPWPELVTEGLIAAPLAVAAGALCALAFDALTSRARARADPAVGALVLGCGAAVATLVDLWLLAVAATCGLACAARSPSDPARPGRPGRGDSATAIAALAWIIACVAAIGAAPLGDLASARAASRAGPGSAWFDPVLGFARVELVAAALITGAALTVGLASRRAAARDARFEAISCVVLAGLVLLRMRGGLELSSGRPWVAGAAGVVLAFGALSAGGRSGLASPRGAPARAAEPRPAPRDPLVAGVGALVMLATAVADWAAVAGALSGASALVCAAAVSRRSGRSSGLAAALAELAIACAAGALWIAASMIGATALRWASLEPAASVAVGLGLSVVGLGLGVAVARALVVRAHPRAERSPAVGIERVAGVGAAGLALTVAGLALMWAVPDALEGIVETSRLRIFHETGLDAWPGARDRLEPVDGAAQGLVVVAVAGTVALGAVAARAVARAARVLALAGQRARRAGRWARSAAGRAAAVAADAGAELVALGRGGWRALVTASWPAWLVRGWAGAGALAAIAFVLATVYASPRAATLGPTRRHGWGGLKPGLERPGGPWGALRVPNEPADRSAPGDPGGPGATGGSPTDGVAR